MFRRINLFEGLKAMNNDIIDIADFILNETFSNQCSPLKNEAKENKLLLNGWSNEEAYFVEAHLPGLKEESIDISVIGKELSIKATMTEDASKEKNYIIRERPVDTVERVITVTDDIDATKIKATYHNGILKIKLPKTESAKPRKVNVITG